MHVDQFTSLAQSDQIRRAALVRCFRLARERARIVREEHALQNADDTPKELDRHEETTSE